MNGTSTSANFAIVEPYRCGVDCFARALEGAGKLRLLALGTRRGVQGVRPEVTRLKPAIGLVSYIAAKTLPAFTAESLRFGLSPWLDHWAKGLLQPGDNVISSCGFANECFKFARRQGGRTFLEGGNSHPDSFWSIVSEELKRWKSPYTPIARHHYQRSLVTVEHTDYVLSLSTFVTRSFLERGFESKRILQGFYPVDLSAFTPATTPRPKGRPLTIISTGRLSLRKGTPYLLEAFRIVRRKHPSARLLLRDDLEDNIHPVMAKYRDLPIEWIPGVRHHTQLADRLREADVFVLPSLEDGFAFTVVEALACGLPVITTPNTGASDFVESDKSGEIVPIRDPGATAEAVLKWAERVMSESGPPARRFDPHRLSVERFEATFLGQLRALGL
jgi:glycosyltransferase involved in cell wall biosynthesis